MTSPDNEELSKLNERIGEAFREAYPDVPGNKVDHMARNFIQVVNGIIDVGEKVTGKEEATHMDIANSLVYWCIANTSLEEYLGEDSDQNEEGKTLAGLSEQDTARLFREFAARTADWLIGMDVLRDNPRLFDCFIRGALAFGAGDWEDNRGELGY